MNELWPQERVDALARQVGCTPKSAKGVWKYVCPECLVPLTDGDDPWAEDVFGGDPQCPECGSMRSVLACLLSNPGDPNADCNDWLPWLTQWLGDWGYAVMTSPPDEYGPWMVCKWHCAEWDGWQRYCISDTNATPGKAAIAAAVAILKQKGVEI